MTVKFPEILNSHFKGNKSGYPEIAELSQWVVKTLRERLDPRIKRQVLKTCLWWAADFSGKIKKNKNKVEIKCTFVSKAALQQLEDWKNGACDYPELVHEHVIPKTVIIDWILEKQGLLDATQVGRLLDLSVYCLILKSEDNKLTAECKQHWPVTDCGAILNKVANGESVEANIIWVRYDKCAIDIERLSDPRTLTRHSPANSE